MIIPVSYTHLDVYKRQALNELQVSADEAIYVGDSDVDIATAKNSGLECVSVTLSLIHI